MINTLVLCDDCWHPAETVSRSLSLLDDTQFNFDYVCTPRDILSKEFIRRYRVIIIARGNTFSAALHDRIWFDRDWCEVMPEDFEQYVREGNGLLALHAGNTFRLNDCPEMAKLIGCEFVFHPKQCNVSVSKCAEHPICRDFNGFTARDEHYVINLTGDDAEVFLKSDSLTEAGTQAAGYTRRLGEGRICALTPGHTLSALSNPEYLKLIANAIKWCAGED